MKTQPALHRAAGIIVLNAIARVMLQLVVAVFNHDFYFDAASRGQQDLPDFVLQSQNIRGLIEEEMTVAKHDISSGFERRSS
jgi:hypothetical protein